MAKPTINDYPWSWSGDGLTLSDRAGNTILEMNDDVLSDREKFLICAAPQMYAALQHAVSRWVPPRFQFEDFVITPIMAAIDAAEGRTPPATVP